MVNKIPFYAMLDAGGALIQTNINKYNFKTFDQDKKNE